ncbi:uncharacterized protein B0H18DRAFT_955878 [Fomitopsis serialis]|uniref:uncharacterized protein n=1 Tax=Fomitopsis serialis TaxID=139415 RepID=UPI00200856E9|nr:uncharacterized protein B0H18DRAFT_955878 [Neoantrodia serialis]KAH9923322.1 hypothetical protein B0H18DRAFT_955878 [Neoantrodia serialis]
MVTVRDDSEPELTTKCQMLRTYFVKKLSSAGWYTTIAEGARFDSSAKGYMAHTTESHPGRGLLIRRARSCSVSAVLQSNWYTTPLELLRLRAQGNSLLNTPRSLSVREAMIAYNLLLWSFIILAAAKREEATEMGDISLGRHSAISCAECGRRRGAKHERAEHFNDSVAGVIVRRRGGTTLMSNNPQQGRFEETYDLPTALHNFMKDLSPLRVPYVESNAPSPLSSLPMDLMYIERLAAVASTHFLSISMHCPNTSQTHFKANEWRIEYLPPSDSASHNLQAMTQVVHEDSKAPSLEGSGVGSPTANPTPPTEVPEEEQGRRRVIQEFANDIQSAIEAQLVKQAVQLMSLDARSIFVVRVKEESHWTLRFLVTRINEDGTEEKYLLSPSIGHFPLDWRA